jgi:hypothetical protein
MEAQKRRVFITREWLCILPEMGPLQTDLLVLPNPNPDAKPVTDPAGHAAKDEREPRQTRRRPRT